MKAILILDLPKSCEDCCVNAKYEYDGYMDFCGAFDHLNNHHEYEVGRYDNKHGRRAPFCPLIICEPQITATIKNLEIMPPEVQAQFATASQKIANSIPIIEFGKITLKLDFD